MTTTVAADRGARVEELVRWLQAQPALASHQTVLLLRLLGGGAGSLTSCTRGREQLRVLRPDIHRPTTQEMNQ